MKVCQVKQKRKIDPSACVGTGAEICNGCMFTVYKRFWKIRLESIWNMPFFGSFQQKISGSNGTSEKVVLFFRKEYSNRKFAFHFFQAFSLIPVSALRGRFPVNRTDLICTNGKRDSGTKLTSPEFFRTICLNRGPIDRSAHANGKQPM